MEYKEVKVIKFATSLEDKADSMQFTGMVLGLFKGIVIGAVVFYLGQAFLPSFLTGFDIGTVSFSCGGFFSLLGYLKAKTEGETLRYQAYSIMCAVQTERNTRPSHQIVQDQAEQPSPKIIPGTFPLG